MRSGCFPTGGRARSRPGLRLRYFRVGGFLATRGLLAHRLAGFVRLPGRDPDAALSVADRDERVESEAPAALHDLGDAIDRDHILHQAVALALPLAALVAAGTAATAAPRPAPPPPLLRRG